MQKEKTIELQLASNAPPFPQDVIADLISEARHLQTYRRVYLAYTVSDPEGTHNSQKLILPTLLLEQVVKVEARDIERMKGVMDRYYALNEYKTRALPMGDWWTVIGKAGVEIRGLSS